MIIMFISPIKWTSICSDHNYELRKLTSKIGYTSELEPTEVESCEKLNNAIYKKKKKKLGISSSDNVVLYLRDFLDRIDDKNEYTGLVIDPQSLFDKVYERRTTIKNNINGMLD